MEINLPKIGEDTYVYNSDVAEEKLVLPSEDDAEDDSQTMGEDAYKM